jgi:hypothetical protein
MMTMSECIVQYDDQSGGLTLHNCFMMCTGSAAQATDLLKLNDMLQYNYADYVNQRLMSFSDVDIEPVYELYGIHSADLDPELCDATLVSDMRATCPIDEMARVAANASRSPVYRYQVCSTAC